MERSSTVTLFVPESTTSETAEPAGTESENSTESVGPSSGSLGPWSLTIRLSSVNVVPAGALRITRKLTSVAVPENAACTSAGTLKEMF